MKFFQETTKWPSDTPNHTYLLSDDKSKMYAYVRVGTKDVFTFKNPIRIDARGRTFKAVENTFKYVMPEAVLSQNPQWKVKGSKGDVYLVERTEHGLTCSCSGFKFRGKCKHLSMI